jgi:hypothetical protein
LPTIGTSDKRYCGRLPPGHVNLSPWVDCEGTDATRTPVDADDDARRADDDAARAFWRAYGSAWGRAARAAGAALAIVGVTVWAPDSPPRVLALRSRLLARVLYIGGGAS